MTPPATPAAPLDLVALTLDLDWAPDFCIDLVASELNARKLKATWFVTHDSPAVRRLGQGPLFELGLHPNFLAGSTQGDSPEAILDYVQGLVPQARAMRTHSLVQSSALLALAAARGVEVDVSLFLPETPHLRPHLVRFAPEARELCRVPYFWEDDMEACRPARTWRLDPARHLPPGLKIFNFHPLYLYLNSDTLDSYQALKQMGPLPGLDQEAVEVQVNRSGDGVATFFRELVDYLPSEQGVTHTISEIVTLWRGSR
jgi:hypothetical protein